MNSAIQLDNVYKGQFDNLVNAIGAKNHFNGEVQFDSDNYSHVLECTLIVSRSYDRDGAGQPSESITDITPVWWNEKAIFEDGETATDFSWMEFRKYFSF